MPAGFVYDDQQVSVTRFRLLSHVVNVLLLSGMLVEQF